MTQKILNDKLSIFMIKKLFITINKVNIKINQAQLTQQVGALFSETLQQSINEIKLPELTEIGENELQTYGMNILEINELCFENLIQVISNEQKSSLFSQQQQSTPKNILNNNNRIISTKDYESLQQAVQKAQQQVRKHIGIEHQMKICLQQVQQQLSELMVDNQGLRKQLVFLKKQLATTKKKQLELVQKVNQAQEKIVYFENILYGSGIYNNNNKNNNNNNKRSKLYTQPLAREHYTNKKTSSNSNKQQQQSIVQLAKQIDTSKKSFNQQYPFEPISNKQKSQKKHHQQQQQNIIKQNINKRPTITRMHTQKLGPRKHSKLVVIDNDNNNYDDGDNDIVVDNFGTLGSFVTLSMQKKIKKNQNNFLFDQQQAIVVRDNKYGHNNYKNTNNNNNEVNNNKTHINTNTNSRQLFWNKRLKKKQSTTGHGLYSDITTVQYSNNRSLNISPRQLKKKKLLKQIKQKQKQSKLKNAYAINVRDNKKYCVTYNGGISRNEETVMRGKCKQGKKQKQSQSIGNEKGQHHNNSKNSNDYFNQLGLNSFYYMRRDSHIDNNYTNSSHNYKFGDRSKSMAY